MTDFCKDFDDAYDVNKAYILRRSGTDTALIPWSKCANYKMIINNS